MALEVFPFILPPAPPPLHSYFEGLFTLSSELVEVVPRSVSQTLPPKLSF